MAASCPAEVVDVDDEGCSLGRCQGLDAGGGDPQEDARDDAPSVGEAGPAEVADKVENGEAAEERDSKEADEGG